MEGLSYISCIKVNGVPILPPMMTKDIREEMSAYKQIAISLEKELMALRDSRFKKRHCDSKENLIPFECNNINRNERNVMDTDDVSPESFESPDENAKQILPWNKQRSDTECTSDHQINIASNIYSRPGLIATSGVADNRQNGVSLTKPSTITTESEILKPQVPKTLNIIPLTLGNPNCGEDEKYQRNGLHNTEDIPKLVRQGSYVLDTPSPILLAHMKMELSSSTTDPCTEYVPTSCTNTVRRKEWNIAQAKMEWENESKSKHCIPVESIRISSKQTKNSDSYTTSKLCKSLSFQTQSEPFFVAYPFARSVDCIQTMLANENVNRSNVQMKYDRRYPTEYKDEKKQRFEKGKKYDSSFTSPSAYKHGVSLENLSSTDVPIYKYTESEDNTSNKTSNNFIKEIAKNIPTENSILNLKSSIASDKLLTVYKKVQEMHKKQMIELVSRQQREQLLLQKEFEKQQLLLLREIKKSFPEISVPLLTENILSTAFSQGTPNSEKHFENIDRSTENLKNLKSNLQEENEVTHLRENNASLIPCLLDYVYSEKNLCKSESCSSKSSLSIDTLEMESLRKTNNSVTMVAKEEAETRLDVRRTNEKKLVEEGREWKRLNVSRQLFPLDSKTIHVPVLDRTIYGSKHIEAATVINAYTRGYLIRRLMRTERVVALKNTYKEALHCMLKLHVDAPLNRSEISFLHRLQLQCDAASMNIVELFAQSPEKRMQVIAQDREIKQSRIERPMSARSYSFATQRTLARKKLKEMEEYQPTSFARSCSSRSRCQTWTSDVEEKLISPNILYHSIKRSTSAGTVRKPWR